MIVKQKLRTRPPGEPAQTIILAANTAWYLANFRLNLARALRAAGYRVLLIAPRDEFAEKLSAEGFAYVDWKLSRTGLGVRETARAFWSLYTVYQRERPIAVHHFTLKCILLGSAAAALARVPNVFNSVTGLGHLFIHRSLRIRSLRSVTVLLLRIFFFFTKPRMIFQNHQDCARFRSLHLAPPARSHLIPTSGIDVSFYRREAPPRISSGERPIVLYAGRILAEKGVREFVAAASRLRAEGIEARFLLAGATDAGNPSSIAPSQLASWKRDGNVELLGHVSDLRPLMAESAVFVLPSYREGGSRVILEAAAMELPVITTDVPGCENLVDHGKTGLVVPVRDAVSLAGAIRELIASRETAARMGAAGRAKVIREFSDEIVVSATLGAYSSAGISGSCL